MPPQPERAPRARYWEPLAGGSVRCTLCDHRCRLRPGEAGICAVRRNEGGRLVAAGYGRVAAAGLDPVEKKPLFHFYPGSYVYTLGSLGCNMGCLFCQNWDLSQPRAGAAVATRALDPASAVAEARRAAREAGVALVGLAFSYNEPLIDYEYLWDAAGPAHRAGLRVVVKTNGFLAETPFRAILPRIDAMNIDLKAFTDGFYRTVARARLQAVLRSIAAAVEAGVHVELSVLLIPGLNDSEREVRALARWVAGLDRRLPVHLARYFPAYRLSLPPTPLETLRRAAGVAAEVLDHVYLNNTAGADATDTRCARCRTLLVRRRGYAVEPVGLVGGACAGCGEAAPVVGEARSTVALYRGASQAAGAASSETGAPLGQGSRRRA